MKIETSQYDRTISHLESEGRTRRLSDDESRRLEHAVRKISRQSPAEISRRWKPEEDRVLINAVRALAQDSKRRQRRKIPQIAERLGRSPAAIRRRLTKLRQNGQAGYISPVNGTGRYPRKGSKAEMQQAGV